MRQRFSAWLLVLGLTSSALAVRPPIVFLSDFGELDDAVAICKGVMLSLLPGAMVIDLTHNVTPYDVAEGARFLAGAAAYYPGGTVFVTVVDPGVGSARKAIVARSKRDQYFVMPDNGLITLLETQQGIAEVREIANPEWTLQDQISSTFHGRDIFSPVAARLARGESWLEVGPALQQWVRLNLKVPALKDGKLEGEIQAVDDPYGNLITNIRMADLEKIGVKMNDQIRGTLGRRQVSFPLRKTFSDVPKGQPLFYIDSKGFLALAVNQGNFQKAYKVSPPHALTLFKAEEKKK